jgi:hypothetical protein
VGGIKWTDKPVKTLGIYFGHDKEECERLNWENKIEKMNNLKSEIELGLSFKVPDLLYKFQIFAKGNLSY